MDYGDGTLDFAHFVPPATLTHTFASAGTFTVLVNVYNDADGWDSASTVVVVDDGIPPAPVTALKATTVTATSIALAWTNPADADFTGVTIRRAAGATAPATASSGTAVTDTAKAATSFTDTGLTAGTQYSYAAFAHDVVPHHAIAASVTATTKAIQPSAPVIGTATAGFSSATVTWTAPVNTGGSAITEYWVKVVNPTTLATIGVLRPVAAGATSMVMTGLVNGTPVRFQVQAKNAVRSWRLLGSVRRCYAGGDSARRSGHRHRLAGGDWRNDHGHRSLDAASVQRWVRHQRVRGHRPADERRRRGRGHDHLALPGCHQEGP